MKKTLLLVVLLLMVAPFTPGHAGDVAAYRALDREARAIQHRLLARTAPVPNDATAALLAFNPVAPPDARTIARVRERFPIVPNGEAAARTWLARDWIRRGHVDGAIDVLAAAGGAAEARLLLADALAQQGREAEAADTLAAVRSPLEWASYARFNRAVLLDQAGATTEAAALLDDLGRMDARGAELLALRDKANIALGFVRLRNQELAGARQAFERVRLDSPFSGQALFGLGWVSFAGGDAARALVPWAELGRNGADRATDEALLLVPRVKGTLGAYREAVEQYREAIDFFEQELAGLDRLIADARRGSLPDMTMAAAPGARLLARSPVFGAAEATHRYLQRLEREHGPLIAAAGVTQRVARAAADHRDWMHRHAAAVFEAERARAADYRERAHFALARLLDEMAAVRRDDE